MSILLTLPPHLIERIDAILAEDFDDDDELDKSIRAGLRKAQQDVAEYEAAAAAGSSSSAQQDADGSDEDQDTTIDKGGEDGGGDTESRAADEKPPPPTIDEEVLLALSKWATSDIGPVLLKRKGLNPLDYSEIALLAGTEVYYPTATLARLRAAENPDRPDPFLPSYLSPSPPSLGSEYRALTRNLSTALNILFSIFGSAGAVYAAGVSGAGYSRETAMLLAILAGVVVGVADGVLVWIFSEKVKKGREEGKRLALKMARGSAPKADVLDTGTDEVHISGEVLDQEDEVVPAVAEKPKIRLRRRAVGESS